MTTPDVFRDAEYIADVSGIQYGSTTEISPTLQDESLKKKLQTAARLSSIDRLLRDLDILIYCELSALYYLDCSIVLFAIRAIAQLIFFTPKAPPFDPTRNQPFIGAIFASNLFCMIFHNFFSQPEAEEATRGYLHGGILIDFIGQKAPVPLTRLFFLDVLVIILHIVMLGLIIERVKIAESRDTTAATTAAPTQSETTQAQAQDHDHEERGVINHETEPRAPPDDGIAVNERREQASHASITSPDTLPHPPSEEELERTRLLADPSENGGEHTNHQHALDTYSSGEAVIIRMGLLDVIRDQWRYRPNTVRRSGAYAPSDQTAAFLRERFGLQVGADGRLERITATTATATT
ncbi:DSC4 family protein [Aspergillus undulatus]|uniref:DSC4 family protein n=1 Tax=Aspergillus undulatus TaxID=1810928 RepID=UPI003CCD281F